MSNNTQLQARSSFIARIQNAFGAVRRDRRGNVWVEYLILVAMLGLAGIALITGLKDNVGKAAQKAGDGIVKMDPYQK